MALCIGLFDRESLAVRMSYSTMILVTMFFNILCLLYKEFQPKLYFDTFTCWCIWFRDVFLEEGKLSVDESTANKDLLGGLYFYVWMGMVFGTL